MLLSRPKAISYTVTHLQRQRRWRWDGRHYEETAKAWLANLDQHRARILPISIRTHGADQALWLNRWRLFFMACAESWGYNDGQEWWVSHDRFQRQG